MHVVEELQGYVENIGSPRSLIVLAKTSRKKKR